MYNFKVKYGIFYNNIYNFNKTGCIISIIIAIIIVTTSNGRSKAKQA